MKTENRMVNQRKTMCLCPSRGAHEVCMEHFSTQSNLFKLRNMQPNPIINGSLKNQLNLTNRDRVGLDHPAGVILSSLLKTIGFHSTI